MTDELQTNKDISKQNKYKPLKCPCILFDVNRLIQRNQNTNSWSSINYYVITMTNDDNYQRILIKRQFKQKTGYETRREFIVKEMFVLKTLNKMARTMYSLGRERDERSKIASLLNDILYKLLRIRG